MKKILERLFNKEELSQQESYDLLSKITRGECNDNQISSLLTVFRMRNVSINELIGFRQALLDTQEPIDFSAYNPIDIVGTGGDGKDTFNISTCACMVVAAAGYKVAKHGNYGATSVSGASTVIELHGVKFTKDHDQLKRSIEESGITYMHAPLFTPALKSVAAVRKSLQFRTIFNLLGPLVNPCRPNNQLLGTADLNQLRLYSNVFQTLNTNYGVVTSMDVYDEISLTSDFKISTNTTEKIYTPEMIGLPRIQQSDLYGGKTAEEAKRIFDDVLSNKATDAQKSCVIANAACAIHIIDQQKGIEECIAQARESIESGKAYATLKKFVEVNS